MKDKIVDVLKKSNHNSYTLETIYNELNLKTEEDYQKLEKELMSMVDDATLYYSNKKSKFCLMEDSHLYKGKLSLNKKGFGFVNIDGLEEDYYIREENINHAMDGDIVVIEPIKGGKTEGKILRVVSRETNDLVGIVYFYNDKMYVKPDSKKIRNPIYIKECYINGVVEGHKVVVKLDSSNNGNLTGQIIKIIGHINDVGIDILSYVYEYGFDPNISDEIKEQLKVLPDSVTDEDIKGRLDLREEKIFTIDGDDTKDIDDAVSIKILPNGNYELGVHIADVTYYVKEGSALDDAAYEKGNSLYLVDRVVPMLPHELSNGICSLNPKVDRLAVSFIMEIDNKGDIVNSTMGESVIRSRLQMTYKKVNDLLDKNIVHDGYEDFAIDLKRMEELSHILRRNRVNKGYIEFNSPEAKILVDETCKPVDIVLRAQGTSERIIEHFMIVTNQVVGNLFLEIDQMAIFRVHDRPDDKKINSFLTFLKMKGVYANFKKNRFSPRDLQELVESLKGREDEKILNDLAIRSQSKAIYSENNIGHFALGVSPKEGYCHITAPIRRYSDIADYRILKLLFKNGFKKVNSYDNRLPNISVQCSKKEQDALNCERDVEKMKKCEYMMDHIGEVFTGTISGTQEFGLFVELPNTVEGLIAIDSLPNDYYYLDETGYVLTGKRSGRKYIVGDLLTVKVVGASKENATVDFEIVKGE